MLLCVDFSGGGGLLSGSSLVSKEKVGRFVGDGGTDRLRMVGGGRVFLPVDHRMSGEGKVGGRSEYLCSFCWWHV
jgi:hypothetical protein